MVIRPYDYVCALRLAVFHAGAGLVMESACAPPPALGRL